MTIPILCVARWRSQWHYRHNKVVVDDSIVYNNIREASVALRMSTFTLHKLIIRMEADVSYSVYKDSDKIDKQYEYLHGDKEVRIPRNTFGKRSRGHDNEDSVRKTRMRVD